MDVRYLILSLFLLASCMPTATVSRGSLSSTETTGGTTSGGTTGTTPTTLTWNYLGQLQTAIAINVSNLNNAYLVGTPVESYLSDSGNFSNVDYCLISSFTIGGLDYQLRSRIVPISYYDFKNKRTVRNFRVDFQDVTNGQSYCYKTAKVRNSSGDYVTDVTPPSSRISYNPASICPSCTNMLTATRTRVFKVASTSLEEVPANYVNTSSLSLQIDPNNTSTGDTGSCSSSTCVSRGFDCCLENQCVQDGATRPAASTTYASLLQTAEQERLQNPLAYLNYPQLYYICGSSVPTTGGSSGGTTSGGSTGGTYDAAFIQLKKDYQCIQNLKSQSTLTPFHNEVLTRTYIATTDCLTASADAAQTFYYQNVLKRLYSTCGCSKTNLAEMISSCPNYDYTVVLRDTQGEPTRIDCYTPPIDSGSVPAEQSVSVSSRSAPHRFFDVNGTERNPADGVEQEGDSFTYLDDGKVIPVQQPFSMNAILGQMSVTLDKALPAKQVTVEMDQVYFISTTSGYYTPCPSCAKDSWLNSFTAFASSSYGVGLQAIGHTTERDVIATNTTLGNYEDTIFGRACWLPPTMIPFSHSSKTTVKDQRRNRLLTQAALFINGYQRDWFGFNKGALIGSFDGVTWFAVGKGRIVRSTSKKLFLAINAPFADLASPTLHVVRVAAYDGITQAAQVDYDPQYHQSHPYQNEAGNCQRFHLCSTDTDCITKLGWEYACADVKDLKTNWPSFDSNAAELAATSSSITIDQILHQKKFASSSTKRCVYRGAGAICHNNSGTLTTDLNKQKLLTCAPNFFCASVSSAGLHNNKIARYAATLEEIPVSRNHLFGKDANVLGRPHDYAGTAVLGSPIANTLIDNVKEYESTLSSYAGLCQPGKALPTTTTETTLSNPFNQHKAADASRRSDFISQIGSCNSSLFTANRHTSCPVLGTDGNYQMFAATSLPTNYATLATGQNACGLESLLSTASLTSTSSELQSSSPFRSIEARPLNSQIIVDPTLAMDACYRRAGSVCHTDLDCSPNKMHATQADFFNTSFFGNAAEKSYWTEYLVCGQADPKPFATDAEAFKNFDMSKNRCCREVGSTLTTYTRDLPTSTGSNTYDSATSDLMSSMSPTPIPNNSKRYSRYAIVEDIGTTSKPYLSAKQTMTSSPNVKTAQQWKTLTEANQESCCGGGWIRKFSDGSNDWTRRDRVVLDVQNFRCINSRNPILSFPEDVQGQYGTTNINTLLSQDYGYYCKDNTNTNGACAQYSILDNRHDVLPVNDAFTGAVINTIKPDYSSANKDFYFKPLSADNDPAVIMDLASTSTTARKHISLLIPSYVAKTTFDDLITTRTIRMERDDGVGLTCEYKNDYNPTTSTDGLTAHACGTAECCFYNFISSSRTLKVWMNTNASAGTFIGKKVGVKFTVTVSGTGLTRTKPGSTAYYLKRLGLLELSGIPQITFEALTCNDNSQRIVPGIFNPSVKFLGDETDATKFSHSTYSFKYSYKGKTEAGLDNAGSTTGYFTNMNGLALDPVFSSNDFMCCSPLGKTVTDASKCCSGYGMAIGTNGTKKTCALPDGANLHVYFNRFVSNEGRGTEQPGGGLTETDFDEGTGEPLRVASVSDKIRALGEAYCASGSVRQGGAFGSFEPEPQGPETNLSGRIYNIVDSSRDNGQSSNAGSTVNTGYQAFMDGFKWNHHLYCDDSGT